MPGAQALLDKNHVFFFLLFYVGWIFDDFGGLFGDLLGRKTGSYHRHRRPVVHVSCVQVAKKNNLQH